MKQRRYILIALALHLCNKPFLSFPEIANRKGEIMVTGNLGMGRCCFVVSLIMICILAGEAPSFAQFDSSSLTGVVADPTNAVISGAVIRVTNEDTNAEVTGTTNAEGRYTFANLRPGTYSVSASAEGFTQAVSSHVILQVNQSGRLDFELAVGAVSEQVSVTVRACPR